LARRGAESYAEFFVVKIKISKRSQDRRWMFFGKETDIFGKETDIFGKETDIFGKETDIFGKETDIFGKEKIFTKNSK
jgi:hypothetical protein